MKLLDGVRFKMLRTVIDNYGCNLINVEKIKSRKRFHLNLKNKSRDMNKRMSCSCSMCGNPRKWFGDKTPQEVRKAA